MLGLAVQAVSSVCPEREPRGFRAQPRRRTGSVAALFEGSLHVEATAATECSGALDRRHQTACPRAAELLIEPMRCGIHGPAISPGTIRLCRCRGNRTPPDYGRMMLCQDGRMLAWIGLYVPSRGSFHDREARRLRTWHNKLALPLRLGVRARVAQPAHPPGAAPARNRGAGRARLDQQGIAKDLDISPATVKTLLERLFRVSGAGNRAALVQWWRAGHVGLNARGARLGPRPRSISGVDAVIVKQIWTAIRIATSTI